MKCRLHDPFERAIDRCDGEEMGLVGGVAGPSRRRRTYGRIDVSGQPSEFGVGLLAELVECLGCWFARGCARASAGLFNLRTRSLPNQAPERNAYVRHGSCCAPAAPATGVAQL